jgi:prophage maintenance system killer protein
MGKGELNITEKRIKDIHAAILYEEDPGKKKLIGRWKTMPNYLYNYQQERVDFTSPEEVPEAMHALINWVNHQKEKIERKDKEALHPVQLAFRFHLEYVTIHPFYDGNGRTARIFTNLILIAYGYPPVYVKTEEKDIYSRYLADVQEYKGDPNLFYAFMTGLLIRSQKTILDAAEGKSIDEPDDLDKKTYLLEKGGFDSRLEEVYSTYHTATFYFDLYVPWVADLIQSVVPVMQKFNKFFVAANHLVKIVTNPAEGIVTVGFSNENPDLITNRIMHIAKAAAAGSTEINISLLANYESFKKGGVKSLDRNYGVEIRLYKEKYEIYVDELMGDSIPESLSRKKLFEKLNHLPLTAKEIERVFIAYGNTIFNHIDYYNKKME